MGVKHGHKRDHQISAGIEPPISRKSQQHNRPDEGMQDILSMREKTYLRVTGCSRRIRKGSYDIFIKLRIAKIR